MDATNDEKPLLIKEGRHTLQRAYFKEGFIDRWMGNLLDHPTYEQKPQLNVGRSQALWRLNGEGDWYEFSGNVYEYLNPEYKNVFTSDEVFEHMLKLDYDRL